MRRFALYAALLSGACVPLAFPQAATFLPCGQMVTGPIDTNNPKVVYTINVPAGNGPETIYLRAGLLGSPVSANLSVLDSNNARINPLQLPPGSPNLANMYSLPASGNYQVILTSAGTAVYQIAYIPTNRPCSNPALTCGKAVAGRLDVGQMQSYQFSGNKGDPTAIFVVRTGGDADATPAFLAFDASGLPHNVITPYLLPSDGLQTFVVLEGSGSRKLTYALNVLDLIGPCATTSISCGSVIDASIGDTLGLGLYSINAASNDVFSLGLVTTDASAGLQVSVQVYDPQGNPVQPSTTTATQLRYLPFAAGKYMVLVQDAHGSGTGKYTLSLARLNNGPCSGAQSIACGTTAGAQIDGPLRSTSYSLNAQANDVYLLRLLKTNTGGSFAPSVEIYGPDGLRVANATTSNLGSVTFSTAASGAYSLIFSDLAGTQSGAYAAWLGRLNGPCGNPTVLQCGAPASGGITQSLQAGMYTYTGDAFTVRMIDTGGSLQSTLQVYAPNTTGQPLPLAAGNTKAVDVAGQSGTYTILVTDQSASPQGGTYALEAIGTKGTCAASPPAGQSVSGLASGPAPYTAYTFAASQGEPLLLRLASFTPGFTANMDLYDPNGKRMGSSTFRLANQAPAGGNYTAVVGASAPRTAGSYAFSWQALDQPAATPLGCGQTVSGALGASSQFSYYNVNANDGDLLKLLLTRLPATVNAQVELFDSKGATVKSSTTEIDQKVSAGGYTVLVSPATAVAESGGFALALQKPNNPCSPLNLTCGQTILQQVTLPGQMDSYVFSGNAGDQVAIQVTPRLGALTPVTELYDPSGNLVLSAPASTSLNANLPAGGQYTLTVHDKAGSNTGTYRVGLQHTNTPCPEDDTQKPTITLLRPTGGEVIAGGTLYQVAWQSDDNTAVTSHTIQLSTDGGKTFAALPGGPSSLNGLAQSYSWTVPAGITPTRTAVIQVTATDKGGNSQTAASDMLTVIGSGFTPNESATYSYDLLNRIVQVAYGDGRIIFYNYDAGGNLVNIAVQ